jgi:hypothetical protein
MLETSLKRSSKKAGREVLLLSHALVAWSLLHHYIPNSGPTYPNDLFVSVHLPVALQVQVLWLVRKSSSR